MTFAAFGYIVWFVFAVAMLVLGWVTGDEHAQIMGFIFLCICEIYDIKRHMENKAGR